MKLTPFGKMFIALVILGVAGFVAWSHFHNDLKQWASGEASGANGPGAAGLPHGPPPKSFLGEVSAADFAKLDPTAGKNTPKTVAVTAGAAIGDGILTRPLVVGINTWAGHAPGIVANGGLLPNAGSHFAEYGVEVKFVLIEDPAAKLTAFIKGDIDVMWDTVDSWAREASILAEHKAQAKSIIMQDWSRGGDGIVSLKSINSIEDLKGKTIATTQYTPSHWLLLYLMSQSGLTAADKADIERRLVITAEAPLAAAAFKAGKVDAAVTWEPDLSLSLAARPDDAHILVSTATATHIIADTLVVRQDIIDTAPKTLQGFVHGWFDGMDLIKADPQAAYAITAKALKLTPDDISGMLSGLKLTPFADNALFYGLTGAKPHFEGLFDAAFVIWRKKGVATKAVEAKDWEDSRFVASLGAAYPDQKVTENFKFDKAPKASDRAIVNKSLSIHFVTGSETILEGSFFVLDSLGETMTSFGNTFLKIEGNTDSRGSTGLNRSLSERRAESVKKYLVDNFQLPPERFVAVGNGAANPIADNKTEDGRALNRRTDIKVVLNAQ